MAQASPSGSPRRPIRSFVLRQGRMTAGQLRALAQLWPRFGLALGDGPLDPVVAFGRRADLVLEIGFGNGEALLACAGADPARDYLGIEVHGPGVGRLLHGAAAAGLGNLRVWQDDAVEVLARCIGPDQLAEVRLFFPDPWPKKRHHKRRLVQPAFLELVRSRLADGGRLHLATDWPEYAAHMLEVASAAPGWTNLAGAGAFSKRPASRPMTHFEQRGIKLGHPVFDLILAKRVNHD
jgi:tRNA (guanine-N7-)-methyltransferase